MNVKYRRIAAGVGAGLIGVGVAAAGVAPAAATVTPRHNWFRGTPPQTCYLGVKSAEVKEVR